MKVGINVIMYTIMSTTATQTPQGMPKRATSSLPGTNMLINSTAKRITKASPDDISKTLVILSLYLFVFISHLKYKRLQQCCSPINTQEVFYFSFIKARIFLGVQWWFTRSSTYTTSHSHFSPLGTLSRTSAS